VTLGMPKVAWDKKAGSPTFSTSTSICKVDCSPRISSSLQYQSHISDITFNLIFIVFGWKKNYSKRAVGNLILKTLKIWCINPYFRTNTISSTIFYILKNTVKLYLHMASMFIKLKWSVI
jgi:hypothetical protein